MAAERIQRGEFGSIEEQIGNAVHYRGDSYDAEPLRIVAAISSASANRESRRHRDDRAEAGRVGEEAVDRIGKPVQRAAGRDSLDARRNREQFDGAARGGRVDHEITILERRVTRHDAETFQQQESLKPRQRGGYVTEGPAAQHPARDGANGDDALDEGFELGARGERDGVERAGDFDGGRILQYRAERGGGGQATVEIGERGRTPARQRNRKRGGDRALAGAALPVTNKTRGSVIG